MENSDGKQANPIRIGWIALGIGLFLCLTWGMTGGFLFIGMPSFLGMASLVLAGPLLLAAMILSVVGMCKDQPTGGTFLLIATLILPPVFLVIGNIVSLLISGT